MRKYFFSFILCLRNHLSLSSELRHEYKRIILTIHITLIGIVATFLFSLLDIAHGHYVNAILDILASIIFIFSLYIIMKGKVSQGKLLIIIYSCFTLFINGSKDGRYSGNEFLWFPIFGAILLIFSYKEKYYMIAGFICILFSVIFMEFTDYSFFLNSNLDRSLVYMNYMLSFSISIIMICLYMHYLIKANRSSEKKLVRLNSTLLRRNDNLKKINNELDSFVYRASHDMRAPLTSLLGLIEVSKKETDLAVLKEFSSMQERSIRKLDSYIIDILNISRNARMEIEKKEIDFIEMIDGVFEQLNFMENVSRLKKDIKINQEVEFFGDAPRLTIIFNNLISNCIRYLDPSKENNEISISIFCTAEQLEITISDNGQGISPEHLTKIFDMFYRATSSNNGSGLGLYILKETLLKLKGTIHVSSEYRKFTTFLIQIPNSKT